MVEPRTTVQQVRDEPGFDDSEFEDGEIQTKMEDAHRIVERRVADQFEDESLLERVETLVTAHLLLPALTGATEGKQIQQVKQQSATVQFAVDENLPGGIDSPFWQDAVRLTDGLINYVDRDKPVVRR